MAEPLKNLLSADVIEEMAAHLANASPDFDERRFLSVALEGLNDLELMQRSSRIVDALYDAYNLDFEPSVDAMIAALHPDCDREISALSMDANGIAGWPVMPLAGYVAQYGLDRPEFSLSALQEMTKRSSSEFAIRPFIRDYPEIALATAEKWARDTNVHVRRLASEGTRPRLPWGIRLNDLVTDPAPILPILTELRDDQSEYVRRSVANSLNDIAKDHPDLVASIASDWADSADRNRKRLIKHACRSLIKNGHPATLAVFGYGPPDLAACNVSLSAKKISLGSDLTVFLELEAGVTQQDLIIDYVIQFLRANGSYSPKVFKWSEITLAPNEKRRIAKKHPYRKVTTRKDYPGLQRLSVRINGQDFPGPDFELSL